MPPARRNRRLLAVAALAIALAAFPLGVLASHQFADVPNSNPFHADIDALADSGVTSGCGGGNFCPSAFVTREQMAAFMNRLGALAAGKVPVVNADRLDGLDSSQLARSDVPVIGHFVCPAASMVPTSDFGYNGVGEQLRYPTASGTFACGVLLPDGATVTMARWEVYDNSTEGQIYNCALERHQLSAGVLNFALMAGGAPTGVADTPGYVTIEDPTINVPVVDNAASAYVASCYVQGTDASTALFRFVVQYEVSGLPVW